MRVVKVLNNNYILVEDAGGKEFIVMGKGLRFLNQVGEELKRENIQKIFELRSKKAVQSWQQLLESIPEEKAEAIQAAIVLADEALPEKFNEEIYITLFDHLIFALERLEKQVVLQNRLLWEVKQFYPKEFALGKSMIEYLNRRLNIELPEEEAGNIAFHLVNAQTENPDMEQTILAVRMMKDISNIVQISFPNRIKTESIHYTRFVTHMQFFLQRVLEHKMLSETEQSIFEQVIAEYPKSYLCANRIRDYIQKTRKIDISQEELLYLTIHIARIVQ